MNSFYSILGDYMLANIFIVQILIFGLMIAAAFLSSIPITYRTYLAWKKDQKPTQFSLTIMLGALSLILLASTYPMFLSAIIKFNDAFSGEFARWLIYFVLFLFLFYFSLPKMLFYFRKFRVKKTGRSFSMMCFFAFLSFYCMSVFFLPIMHSAIFLAR